jgi:hypothetical protein
MISQSMYWCVYYVCYSLVITVHVLGFFIPSVRYCGTKLGPGIFQGFFIEGVLRYGEYKHQ